MGANCYWLFLLLLAPELTRGESPPRFETNQCPRNWVAYGNFCYRFLPHTRSIPGKSWEFARAYCRVFGGDLVSIGSSQENFFIRRRLFLYRRSTFWLGLYRNSSGEVANQGWIWMDGTEFTYSRWGRREPNNWGNNERCGEVSARTGYWNDINCYEKRSTICKRKKDAPLPTRATTPTTNATTTQPEVKCDSTMGWKPFRKSCYKISHVSRPWATAKKDCGDLGGHLLKIDDKAEQDYFYKEVRNLWHSRFWIGLYDPARNGSWQWESDGSSPRFLNWHQGEPNGKGVESCVEMYAGSLAASWNDHVCGRSAKYICEKEEGKSACPDDWVLYGDNCYQFNLASSQLKSWTAAKQACESIGEFSSLVSILNKDENDFLRKQINSAEAQSPVWIGLNDRQLENVFKWSDNSKLNYSNWMQNNPRNRAYKDCTVLLGMREDAVWTTQLCSETRRYICKRHKGFFNCDAPLGMENGKIGDDQITSKKSTSPSMEPLKSRLGGNGTWCQKAMDDYLQIDMATSYKITKIAVQGSASSYCIHYGKDGKAYKPYGAKPSTCEVLSSVPSTKPHYLENLRPFIARYIRITPIKSNTNSCVQLELYGCLGDKIIDETSTRIRWFDVPSTQYQLQFNHVQLPWTDARSFCLEQRADLVSLSSAAIIRQIRLRLNRLQPDGWWIGLTGREYPYTYYWTDASPVNYIGWGGYIGYGASYSCVYYQKMTSRWRTADCGDRKPFVCMRKAPNTPAYNIVKRLSDGVIQNGVTGVWISSATHYWPLSNVDDGKISGTIDGRAFGNINVVSGVKNKSDSALQFSKPGMYIDVPFEYEDCLTFPDTCPSKQLTLSFMASFDAIAANWNNVVILDSLGGSEQNSTGISVSINRNNLVFVVSYVHLFWKLSIPIQGDGVWRHYALVCAPNNMQIFVNGKSVISRAYEPSSRKQIPSKNSKRNFHIGLQPNSKQISSGAFGLATLAFWEGVISSKDIRSIYMAKFGWCPNGWVAFGTSCYEFANARFRWEVARLRCQTLGGDLVKISTPVEQAFITSQIKTTSWNGLKGFRFPVGRRLRIGRMSRTNPMSHWRFRLPFRSNDNNQLSFAWHNRSPVLYTNWGSHNSFSYRLLSSCGTVLGTTGYWSQIACTTYAASICEKEKDETKPVLNVTVVDVPKFTRVCHYSRALLSCPSGSVIKIQGGFWGRTRRDVCRYVSIIDCGLDTVPAITKKLKAQCDGSSTCTVQASSDPKHLGNPCVGVYKYLEVNYTCVLEENLSRPCPSGWVRGKFDSVACYRLIQSKKNWNESEKACQEYGAQLISIKDKSEQVLATTLMESVWNTDVWIGLSRSNNSTPGTFTWSDKTQVTWTNWAVENPRGSWTGDNCVYMNLQRTTKDLMYWKVGNCNKEKLFICKKIISAPNTKKTPEQAPTRSCRTGWTLFKNYCYRYHRESLTWLDALKNCRRTMFYGGNSLASITSKEENDFIANLANTTVWIGLDGKGVYRGHAWTDNTPVSYTNWDVGQPDSYNGREACTQLYADVGYWADVNCYLRRPFVCKTKAYPRFGPRPTVSPKLAESPRCKKGWYLFNNMCYNVSAPNDYKTWHDAENSCKLMGGHLASVTSLEEKDFLKKLSSPRLLYSFWIGLHDVGGESLYRWTDGTGYGKFIYWRNGEPNDMYGQEDCVAMVRVDGKWNDNHCSQKKPYICKSKTEDAPKITTINPATKVVRNGYCAHGWVANGKYCYEFHTDESDYKSWLDAKNACEQGKSSSKVGELVSITNEIEQAFITLNLKGAKSPLWIGMSNLHNFRAYFWADSSPTNFYHWNKNQPLVSARNCVEISPFEMDAGKWSSTPCDNKKGYICKTAAQSTPVGSAASIPTVSQQTTASPSFTCPKGYIQYDESCYMFVNTPKTFDEATDVCRKEKAELISVNSEFEQALLVFLMERNLGTVWIGLSRKPYSSLKFTDHSVTHFTYWGAGQPNRQRDQRTCVIANVTGYHVGRWDDVDCKTKNPFVCEIYHGEKKTTLEVDSFCEEGWVKYRTNCYKHFPEYSSWPRASYTCQNNGGHLVSIEDDSEQNFLMFHFSNKPRTWLWIGMHDRSYEGGYEWTDKSPLTYSNWKDNQPNDATQTENCVLMDSRNGQWFDWRCGSYYAFICKKTLECSSKIKLNKDMITVSNEISANLSANEAILDDNSPESAAWCPNITTRAPPRIQIDLFKLVKLSSVTIKGRIVGNTNQFVQSFTVDYAADGYSWQTYSRKGIDVTFFANTDGETSVTKTFDPPIVASSIAILPTKIKGKQPCMKLSLQGCDFVCQGMLGMVNARIPDDSITASSFKDAYNAPQNARPKSAGWCAQKNDYKQWIQVNLGRTNLITKIRTFGDTGDSYVKRYKIQISSDGIEWVDYKQDGSVRIFKGNLHAAHPVTNSLNDVSQAQFIRIVPTSWNKNICMRFELFGCVADCDKPLIENDVNVKLTSSFGKPNDARMNSEYGWCTSRDGGKYLQVDFGKEVRLTHIGVKGTEVFSYRPEFYRNKKWRKYEIDNSVRYIVSRNNFTTLSKYPLNKEKTKKGHGIIATKVRIYLKESASKLVTSDLVCMKVEFYGCQSETEIIPITPSTTQEEYQAGFKITSIEWDDKFNDKSSKEFKRTSKIISREVTSVYENNKDSREGEALRKVNVITLRKGSVIVELLLVFNPTFAKNENVSKPLMEAVRSGRVGLLRVDKSYFYFSEKTPKVSASLSENNGLSNGAIAGVVVAVLLVILLAVGIGIYWVQKRKRDPYGPKQFNNPILYSTANTDEFDVE